MLKSHRKQRSYFHHFNIMTKPLAQMILLGLALSTVPLEAATKYWDINGATAGSGQGTGAGTWNTTGLTWTTDPTGASAATTFAASDAAVFSAGTDATSAWTINVPSALTAGSLTVEEGTVTKTGSALTTQTIVVSNGAGFFINAALALTVSSPGGTCTLYGGTVGNANTGTGGSFFGSGTANANMGIVLSGGGHVSATGGAGIATIYTGLISGTGPLTVDGNGIFRLTTTTATYSGDTIVNGRLQLSTTANVLPSTTDMTINSGGTFDDEASQTNASLSGSGTLMSSNTATVLTCGSSANTSFSGPVIGNGTFTKVGNGTFTISGNHWQNTTTNNINGGTLLYGDSAAGFSANSIVSVGASGTLDLNSFSDTWGGLLGSGAIINNSGPTGLHVGAKNLATTFSGVISGTAGLEKQGTATLTLSGPNTYSGKTTISGGLLTINNASGDTALGTPPVSPVADQLIFNGGALALGSTANVTLDPNRGITLNAGGGQIQGSSKDLTIPGNIVGPGALIKTNSANLTLSGANSFAGNFSIFGGGVRFNGDDTAGHGTVIVGPTTAIVTLRNLSPTLVSSLTNNVTLNAGGSSDIDITCAAGNVFSLSGTLTGPAYLTRGRSSGASGIVNFSGHNTGWTGGLYWGRGGIGLGDKDALGTGAVTITNLAPTEPIYLIANTNLTGSNGVTNGVSLVGSLTVSNGSALELSGPIALAAGAETITNQNASATTLSGIISGAASLTVAGSGTLTLSAANTYSGNTTNISGTLALVGGGSVASPYILVGAGATIDVTGRTDGTLTVSPGQSIAGGGTVLGMVNLSGTISPGTSPGTLTTGPSTWNAGAHYTWQINNPTNASGADPGWDLVNIVGGLNLNAFSSNKIVLNISSLTSSNTAGGVETFDNTANYAWTIVTTTEGVTNFDANVFALDFNSFSNSLGSGTFTLALANSGKDIQLRFGSNNAPVVSAPGDVTMMESTSTNVTASATDADVPSSLTFSLPGAPAFASISPSSGVIMLSPGASTAGDYTITVVATDNAPTPASGTNSFVVHVVSASPANPPYGISSITVSNTTVNLTWESVSGTKYQILGSTDLTAPLGSWTNVGGVVTATGSTASQADVLGPTQTFYRVHVVP
jgi:autotransporter-associated beta strand protein